MPMRPVREDVYDTAPMRPMNIRSGYEDTAERLTVGVK